MDNNEVLEQENKTCNCQCQQSWFWKWIYRLGFLLLIFLVFLCLLTLWDIKEQNRPATPAEIEKALRYFKNSN